MTRTLITPDSRKLLKKLTHGHSRKSNIPLFKRAKILRIKSKNQDNDLSRQKSLKKNLNVFQSGREKFIQLNYSMTNSVLIKSPKGIGQTPETKLRKIPKSKKHIIKKFKLSDFGLCVNILKQRPEELGDGEFLAPEVMKHGPASSEVIFIYLIAHLLNLSLFKVYPNLGLF